MTTINSYATLADFLNYTISRSTTAGHVTTIDAVDDVVAEKILEAASRYMEDETARHFYPRVETRYFDTPDGRELPLCADLLEVLSVTNGDGTSLASTEYNLVDKNASPYYGIKIKPSSAYYWTLDAAGSGEYVISVQGIWGYHNRYGSAWKVATTISEDLDVSETAWDVASSSLFVAGQIVRVGNELSTVSSAGTSLINVVARGENGSTAATHSSGATVYIWQPMEALRNAVIEMTNNAYRRRFGESLRGEETVTAAGIVITPRDVPKLAKEFIDTFARKI